MPSVSILHMEGLRIHVGALQAHFREPSYCTYFSLACEMQIVKTEDELVMNSFVCFGLPLMSPLSPSDASSTFFYIFFVNTVLFKITVVVPKAKQYVLHQVRDRSVSTGIFNSIQFYLYIYHSKTVASRRLLVKNNLLVHSGVILIICVFVGEAHQKQHFTTSFHPIVIVNFKEINLVANLNNLQIYFK